MVKDREQQRNTKYYILIFCLILLFINFYLYIFTILEGRFSTNNSDIYAHKNIFVQNNNSSVSNYEVIGLSVIYRINTSGYKIYVVNDDFIIRGNDVYKKMACSNVFINPEFDKEKWCREIYIQDSDSSYIEDYNQYLSTVHFNEICESEECAQTVKKSFENIIYNNSGLISHENQSVLFPIKQIYYHFLSELPEEKAEGVYAPAFRIAQDNFFIQELKFGVYLKENNKLYIVDLEKFIHDEGYNNVTARLGSRKYKFIDKPYILNIEDDSINISYGEQEKGDKLLKDFLSLYPEKKNEEYKYLLARHLKFSLITIFITFFSLLLIKKLLKKGHRIEPVFIISIIATIINLIYYLFSEFMENLRGHPFALYTDASKIPIDFSEIYRFINFYLLICLSIFSLILLIEIINQRLKKKRFKNKKN